MTITDVMNIIRFSVYAWVVYEVSSLITMYYFSYKDTKSSYICGLILLSSSILSLFLVLMIINIITMYIPSVELIVKNGIILPSILIGLSTHSLRFIFRKKL